MRRPALCAAVVLVALAVSVADAGVAAAVRSSSSRRAVARPAAEVDWRQCGPVQCARVVVPLDDTRTDGPTISIALTRVRARDPEHRIGSLLVNPGGPGVAGTDYALDFASEFPSEVRDRFDIVGFDPRGTGSSAPFDCVDDLDPFFALDFSPDSPDERATLLAGAQRLVDACVARSGAELPFLSTERAARDLDRLREALGDDKLSYVGFSYGTYLGALYAEQFPTRVRALVLDGAIDPALSARDQQVQQAMGFEHSLDAFLRWCGSDSGCSFHQDGHSARAFDRLHARVDRDPIPAMDGRVLNETNFDLGVAEVLYGGRRGWPTLATALADAADGNGARLLRLGDQYTGRDDHGSYDNLQEAFYGIGCLDGPPMGGVEGVRAIEDAAAIAAPRLGRAIVNASLVCALWPDAAAPTFTPHAAGAPPILVIGTRNDPATPLAWATSLSRELRSGVLLQAKGSQHTAFASGNRCVDDAVTRYLVGDGPPRSGTRC